MKYNPTLHKLSNGVTVILDPMDTETTNVAVSFKTGSLDETPKEYGLTHFCEHMLCNGTARFPTRKAMVDYISENAGIINAFTSRQELRLHGRILGDNVAALIDVLADQLQNSLFLPEKIDLERIVILDELFRSKDSNKKADFMSRTLFKSPLYSFQTLGTEQNIRSFTRDQMLDWLSKRLSAKNCTIAISGKIKNPNAILQQLENKFAFLPTHDVKNANKPNYTPAIAHHSSNRKKNVSIFVAIPKRFKIDDSQRFKRSAERRFKAYLQEELYDEIRQKHGLVYGISVGVLGGGHGLHYIETECAPSNVGQVVGLIAQTCKRVYESGHPDDEWLRRFTVSLQLGDADWLDSPSSRLDTLVSHYAKNGSLYDFFGVVKLSDSITSADVQKYSRGFFDVPISIITEGPNYDADLGAIWKQNFQNSNLTTNLINNIKTQTKER
ncbi:MAG: M16 family metallopeptidase [Alphaproteobacteria bacterium]